MLTLLYILYTYTYIYMTNKSAMTSNYINKTSMYLSNYLIPHNTIFKKSYYAEVVMVTTFSVIKQVHVVFLLIW